MNECGLSYNFLLDKTYAYKSKKCHGKKGFKEQLAILVGVNRISTKKLPLLVIGKLKKHRCILNVKSLPCEYESNKKALNDYYNFRKVEHNYLMCSCDAHFKDLLSIVTLKYTSYHLTLPQFYRSQIME